MTHCPHCGKALNEAWGEVVFSERELARFWKHVTKGDGCWICDLGPSHIYSRLYIGGRRRLGHVVSWMIEHGDVPPGKKICHTCDNPKCVRPDHLFCDTDSANILDAVRKGRHKPCRGAANGNSKLTQSDAVFIRESLIARTASIKALADKFEVSFQNIYRIALGKTWKHLGPPIITLRPVRRLTQAERSEIQRLAALGIKQFQIAEQFGLWQAEVSHVVNGTKHYASKGPA